MADFNTDVVKIGKSANRSGGGAQGSDVIVGTEKKFGGLNSGAKSEGQRDTKVDREDGPMATLKVLKETAQALTLARNSLKNQKGGTMTQQDLASKANVDLKYVKDLERAGADKPEQKWINAVQRVVKIHLTGNNIGETTDKFAKKKKGEALKTAEPKSAEPISAEPKSAEPMSAEPISAQP